MTPRQAQILAAIIEQYAKTAEPIGSLGLAEKFDVSPATIRAEMGALEQLEYIYQPHISAGRVPTDKGYRVYVNALQNEEVSARNSQVLSRRLAETEAHSDRAIKIATATISDLTGNMGLATLSDHIYFHGYGHLFNQPEFLASPMSFEVARFLLKRAPRERRCLRVLLQIPCTLADDGHEQTQTQTPRCTPHLQ